MFAEQPPVWGTAVNIHNKVVQLADGLKIAALGGAGPIHIIDDETKEKNIIYPNAAYPYGSEENYKVAV